MPSIYKQNCKQCNKLCKRKFCSLFCYRKNKTENGTESLICKNCYNPYIRSLSQIKIYSGNCCSWKCRIEYLNGKTNPNWKGKVRRFICKICNIYFERGQYTNNKIKFCSKKCTYISFKDSFSINGNPNWQGGLSFKEYPQEFNKNLKDYIRERDNYICKKCGKTEQEELKKFNRVLSVHHIDYDKQNCNKNNLITTCNSCNNKINFNRNYWKEYFNNILNNKFFGELNSWQS